MHAAAVVAHDGFGHEGGGFAEVVRGVLDDVFHVLRLVGAAHQRVEAGADFHLAAGADFGVVDFDFDADFFQIFTWPNANPDLRSTGATGA